MEAQFLEATLTIDLKKNRFRVNRRILIAIGTPKYILMMVDPKAMTIAVVGSDKPGKQTYMQAATLWMKDRSRSVEVYSKALVRDIRKLVPDMKLTESYHLRGRILPTERIAEFSLQSAERVDV